jgi:hypothetical protein
MEAFLFVIMVALLVAIWLQIRLHAYFMRFHLLLKFFDSWIEGKGIDQILVSTSLLKRKLFLIVPGSLFYLEGVTVYYFKCFWRLVEDLQFFLFSLKLTQRHFLKNLGSKCVHYFHHESKYSWTQICLRDLWIYFLEFKTFFQRHHVWNFQIQINDQEVQLLEFIRLCHQFFLRSLELFFWHFQ